MGQNHKTIDAKGRIGLYVASFILPCLQVPYQMAIADRSITAVYLLYEFTLQRCCANWDWRMDKRVQVLYIFPCLEFRKDEQHAINSKHIHHSIHSPCLIIRTEKNKDNVSCIQAWVRTRAISHCKLLRLIILIARE